MTLDIALRHDFGGTILDITIAAPSRGITALFGRSGAGKSSVINAVAGIWRPDICRIAIDELVLADTARQLWLPPERRRAGLVFQDARLFPHMSVENNLRFGLRRAPAAARRIGLDDVVNLLGITALLPRRPHSLSGGEKQRVAIGRALLSQPRLLLMDEPLASLDDQRRQEILPYLSRLNTALGLPTLYVTHSLDEVVRLADHVVLLRDGHTVASGSLEDMAGRGDLPLAQREDAGSVLRLTVSGHDEARALTRLTAGESEILVPLHDLPIGAVVRVRVPAREVILAHPAAAGLARETSLHNVLPGTVRAITLDRPNRAAHVEVALPGLQAALLSRVTEDAVTRLGLAPGMPLLALVKSVAVEIVGAKRGRLD